MNREHGCKVAVIIDDKIPLLIFNVVKIEVANSKCSLEDGGIEPADEEPIDRGITKTVDALVVEIL